MDRKILFLVLSTVAAFAFPSFAQNTACPRTDIKCRIDEQMARLQKDPKDVEAYYELGLVYLDSDRLNEAVEIFGMYVAAPVKVREHLADGYNNRGIALYRLGRYDDAAVDLLKAMELNGKDPKPPLNLGNVYRQQKKFDLALKQYDASIKVDPGYAPAYLARGFVFSVTGNNEKALADFESAVRLDPAEPEGYYSRGTIRFQQKEYAKALPDYDKYIELGPADAGSLRDGYVNRAICRYFTGSLSGAIDDATKAIETDPTAPKSYQLRATLYREQKSNDLAEADEKKARELSGSKAQ